MQLVGESPGALQVIHRAWLDRFGLDDIIDLLSDVLPDPIAGAAGIPFGGDAGAEPAVPDTDGLMAEQAERIPELQQPMPDGQEPAQPDAAELPSADERKAMVDAEQEQQEMADTLSTLSSMRHQTAMNTIGNIR